MCPYDTMLGGRVGIGPVWPRVRRLYIKRRIWLMSTTLWSNFNSFMTWIYSPYTNSSSNSKYLPQGTNFADREDCDGEGGGFGGYYRPTLHHGGALER